MTAPPLRWGFVISLAHGLSVDDAVRLALRRAGVPAASIEIDAERRSVLAHVEGDVDWWAVWRDMIRETQTETWTVILEQPAPITEIDPPEWWHTLRAGDKVRPTRDGVPILYADGKLRVRMNMKRVDGSPEVLDVWAPGPDVPARRICVFNERGVILYVAAGDVEPA